ncbi:ATP-binding cassette domain-containing protein [Thiospirochaeta perfilievii]|uniref:ATP-binding cassette domain-containing protein n=1 Tax=Thiospirochaeta perfilievii TaxID=252967 RepID=A0A5C1QD59_9SPIO|nr:ATP-binding cassette domain-containing protein [Thiospirochaeta perfilievii]QEN04142.1 ATP-binding cassette domain-containing protein [Thiospirochaeta perfilievii]
MPVLSVKNIHKTYIDQIGSSTVVLNGVNLDLFSGDFTALMGSSGCGKTTLLKILGTLDKPTLGNVFFSSKDLTTMTKEEQSLLRLNKIGIVFQNSNLLDSLTIEENIVLPMILKGINKKIIKNKLNEMLVDL